MTLISQTAVPIPCQIDVVDRALLAADDEQAAVGGERDVPPVRGAVEQAGPLQRGGQHTAVTAVDGVAARERRGAPERERDEDE